MPIYKLEGKKNGLQKYRVRVNFTDNMGKAKQIERVAYGKEEAMELEAKLRREVKEAPIQKMTVQELYEEYVRVKKYEVRESTIDKTIKLLETFILPDFKNYRLEKLTPSMFQKWKTELAEKTTSSNEHFSLKYKRNIFGELRGMLNYAVKMEYILKSPLTNVGNFKDANTIKKEMDFYTPDEFKKFIKASYNYAQENTLTNINEWNYYVFFNIAFYTGMRKGEIYALKWTDINNDTIYVTRSIAQKLSGGDRETPPKNKSSIRDIQVPIPLKNILDEHYERYKAIDRFNDDWRICGGQRCLRDSTVAKRNKLYASLAGLKSIRIHDYRHSHVSLLANNSINIQEIARRLGHSNVEITWNTYSHLYPQEKERAIQILNKIV